MLYPIFTRRIAFKLEQMGFKLVKIEENHKKKGYSVYFFNDTVELHEALLKITQEK